MDKTGRGYRTRSRLGTDSRGLDVREVAWAGRDGPLAPRTGPAGPAVQGLGRPAPAPSCWAIVRAVTRLRRGSPWLTAVVVLVAAAGCGVSQRPSVKVVDPELVEHGIAMERERQRGGFALGPYVVRDSGVRSEAADPDGPLAREGAGRPVTQHRAGLVLEAPETGRTWTSTCTLQRRAPVETEFHAVLDENGDEIAVDCTASAKGMPPWRFRARALLSSNFVGRLWAEGDGTAARASEAGDGDEGSDAPPPTAWPVEILTRATYFQRLERLERLLPVPVAQLRHDRKAVVSVLLGRPERAWVAEELDATTREAALALLLTLRLLPWELAE